MIYDRLNLYMVSWYHSRTGLIQLKRTALWDKKSKWEGNQMLYSWKCYAFLIYLFFFYFKMHSTCNFPQHYENMSRTLTKNLQKQASLCAAHEQVWKFFLWHSFPSALTHINLPMQERNACRKVIKKWNYYCSEYLDRSKIESAFITYWQQKSHNLPHRKSLKHTRLHYPLFCSVTQCAMLLDS